MPVDEVEIVSETPLHEPDKEDFEGYTGNAGMTLERWYHRAAVMLWPAESRFDVLCEAGMDAAVGGLEQMVKQWQRAKKSEQSALRRQCVDFAERIIAHWPERKFADGYVADDDYEDDDSDEDEDRFDEVRYDDDDDGFHEDNNLELEFERGRGKNKTALLPLLEALGDEALVADWLRRVLARDVSIDPGKCLGDICQQHGWLTFQDDLLNLFECTSNETIERHARLLADWSLRQDKNADCARLCASLARRMMSAVEGWDPRQAKRKWRARRVNCAKLLPPLAQSFITLKEPELFERLATYILDRPKEFDQTTIQIPALLGMEKWLKRNVKSTWSPLRRWLAAVVKELESRASNPPQEPVDWRRESTTGCNCADCKILSRFLKDPNTKILRLPLAQARRQHLHQVIDEKKLDTTHVTERKGSPYTLVCTKTQASHARALKAHQVDLAHRVKIRKLQKWHDGLRKRKKA